MNVRRATLGAVTTLAWVALVVDATPWWFDLADDLARLLLTVAGVGTVVIGLAAISRPAAEVYELGRQAGRMAEKVDSAANRTADVIPFRSRRSG